MKLRVPITGTVTDFDPECYKLDGIGISGHPDDPVSVAVDLGNVSWRLVSIDLINDLAEIEVSPGENITVLKAGGNPNKPEDWTSRAATEQEKQGFLNNARSLVESHTKDELYTIGKSRRLVKTAEAVEKYEEVREQLLGGSK